MAHYACGVHTTPRSHHLKKQTHRIASHAEAEVEKPGATGSTSLDVTVTPVR